MSISFGIAGTGWVAEEYIKWIENHPEGRVAGVVSRDRVRAELYMKSKQISGKVYGTFQEMADDPDIDAIVLCSTPESRAEQAVAAARSKKHLIIEKPVTLDTASLMRMEEAIREHRICTAVSFVLRWNPLFDLIKSQIAGALGNIFMASVDYWHNISETGWSSKRPAGGSSTLSAGCHAVDALRYFAGEVTEVTAYSRKQAGSQFEYDPNVLALLKLKNGGMDKVSSLLQCKSSYTFNIQLHGDKGTMLDNKLFSHLLQGQTDYAEIPTIMPDSGDVAHHPFKELVSEFISAIGKNAETRCSFADAFRSMQVCFAMDQSALTGKPVYL